MASPKRKVSAPATTRRPKTRRDVAIPHYDEPVSVPASVLAQVANMRRCILAKDGKPVSDNRNWVEVLKGSHRVDRDMEADSYSISFRTEDGRQWRVTVEEVR